MLEDYEKKLNKWLLNFIIWGSYLWDYGQHAADHVRDFVMDVYAHLVAQWERVKKWYRE